jgi:hypothetical protein
MLGPGAPSGGSDSAVSRFANETKRQGIPLPFSCRMGAVPLWFHSAWVRLHKRIKTLTGFREHLDSFHLRTNRSRQIRNQSTPKSFLLNLPRYLPGIDNQPVYLDEPSHGVVAHPAGKRPMRVRLPGLQQIHDGCFCPTPRKGKISQTTLIFSAVALPQPP